MTNKIDLVSLYNQWVERNLHLLKEEHQDKPVLSAYTVPIPVLDCVKELKVVVERSQRHLEELLAEGYSGVPDEALVVSDRLSGALRAIHYISEVYGVKNPARLE